MSNIGENIRKYRKARGMSQEQLSFEVGVKRAVISKYENGFIAPSLAMIEKIAKALDVTISEIYIGLSSALVQTPEGTIADYEAMENEELIKYYQQLNKSGKEEALCYIQYLTTQTKYTKADKE